MTRCNYTIEPSKSSWITPDPGTHIPPARFGRRRSPWRSLWLWALLALMLVGPPVVALVLKGTNP